MLCQMVQKMLPPEGKKLSLNEHLQRRIDIPYGHKFSIHLMIDVMYYMYVEGFDKKQGQPYDI